MNKICVKLIFLLAFCVSNNIYAQSLDFTRELKQHIDYLTADSLGGRLTGTKGELLSANYIYDELQNSGLNMLNFKPGQRFSLTLESGDTINSINVIAVVEGYDPKLKEEFIVVGAHFDNLGMNKLIIDGKEVEQIYPGADNNASGVSVLLELAKKVKFESFMFKRSVVFVAFGAQEQGLLGSWYFLNGGFSRVDKINMMVNIDMVGRTGDKNPFQLFTMSGALTFEDILYDISFRQTGISPILADIDDQPSDHRTFHNIGIPVAYFTTGLHREFHTQRDISDRLDYKNMQSITNFIYNFVLEVANMEESITRKHKLIVNSSNDGVLSLQDVDKRPTFLYGNQQTFLDRWVYAYLKYPESTITGGVQGTVMVEFVIEKDGSVTNVKIVRSLDEATDKEVIKVVSASPDWKPAELNGIKTRVKISIPIEFRLK